MSDIYGLILAGGSGVRLWPRSREELPKQFLSLRKGYTMLQDTVTRMLHVLPPQRLYAVAGGKWRALVSYQAREVAFVPEDFLIEEPVARNTAPAILLGCCALKAKGASDDAVVVVAPSDHLVNNVAAFEQALHKAVEAAKSGFMVTLGITPTRPDTGFGYIRCPMPEKEEEEGGEEEEKTERGDWFEVEQFIEKPDLEAAKHYMKSGEYFWNGGIFIFTLGTLYRELEHTSPDLYEVAQKGYDAFLEDFQTLPSISFDYAVMERAQRVAMVELDAGWSDVGSWDALYEVLDKDGFYNATIGDVLMQGTKRCLVDSRNRLTTLVDVEDMVIIDSPDALFISKRGSSSKVREVVEKLRTDVRKEAVQAMENARPWGIYTILCEEERFKIKRIVITPGKRLSLQYHHHRSEHWVVVRGTAFVVIDGKEQFVHEGESVFIPKNARHRLENPGKVELEIVEVQGGEYLGEDDIVRLDDDFKRS
ncbi:MAG: mannose-1-phosphate guanylyltransferase/mannose-6-phosphate isomerase [Synergistaceae bacterium]|jgi:mannose-1-phosphate guanylyltransferase/mannose-6-phosphate isomerase|nr:mannose-1-phosphate guanylyltransferase/mannose-6-phosphate isomerase [Synergistaceae bacterium]